MNRKISFFTVFLAWRYICATKSKSTLLTMMRICFLSIVIGTFSLAFVTAIMQGFESALHEKLRGIHSHIIIQQPYEELAIDSIDAIINTEFPEVHATAPTITQNSLIYTQHTKAPLVGLLKGIDPEKEQLCSCLHSKVIAGDPTLESMIYDNCVIVGKEMADELNVTIGDSITIAYSDELFEKKNSITFETSKLIIKGIFQTGLDEIDSNVLFCDYRLIQKLFSNATVSTLQITLKPGFDEDVIASKLENRFRIPCYSWKKLYPALISTLALEKYAMFLILALITLIASANIIALLFMIITQKRADIALLITLGASKRNIKSIFIFIGMLIAQSASVLGIILAWIVSFLMNHYHIITLPDMYYTSHLRADMSIEISCLVFALVTLITLSATFIATKNINKSNIAEIMRYDR